MFSHSAIACKYFWLYLLHFWLELCIFWTFLGYSSLEVFLISCKFLNVRLFAALCCSHSHERFHLHKWYFRNFLIASLLLACFQFRFVLKSILKWPSYHWLPCSYTILELTCLRSALWWLKCLVLGLCLPNSPPSELDAFSVDLMK